MKRVKTMERYKVIFEASLNGTQWDFESFSNGGRGLDIVEASAIKNDLERYGLDDGKVRNVRIVKM